MFPPSTPITRRTVLTATGGLGLATLTGCGPSSPTPGDDASAMNATQWPTHVPPPVVEGGRASALPGVPTLHTTPLTTLTQAAATPPGDGGELTTFQILWGTPPQDDAQNQWLQELNTRLNVTYRATLAPGGSYNDRFATLLASGDLPDLMFVQDTTPQGLQGVTDGALNDLTDLLAGDNILAWPHLAHIRTETWQRSSKHGRILGIPNEDPVLTRFPAVRSDALTAIGATDLGTTAEEFRERFIEMGRLGVLHGKQFHPMLDLSAMTEIVEWMFGIGPEWQLDDGGRLRSKYQHPRYVEVVEYLRRFWDGGTVHPDPTASNRTETLDNGQIGFNRDSYNAFFLDSQLRKLRESTPGADLTFFVPPAAKDADLTVVSTEGWWGIVGISSRITDQARIRQLLDILNWFRSPYGTTEYRFINDGIEGVHHTVAADGTVTRTRDTTAQADHAALSWLGVSPVNNTYLIPPDLADKADNFFTCVETLAKDPVSSPVLGLVSETASRSSGTRGSVRDDYLVGMLYGRRPVTDYPDFVAAWLKAGGQEALDDYQARHDARQAVTPPSPSPTK
ncbi:hypothetical protein EII34_09905 [Arachnia propionica]|uniref:Uncharacterized protein n=1 Tax=Arachnia propionica TaxID=1750 RepID=A0A3P1T708_9ACTN|nr:hypothetical protein [Arachnia propionica]MDO5084012.1 hypothetical protein [Arachnia propionica]RRD04606.1 hypothetical protein EII34_09905 [Arachnia propionica]